MWSDKSIQRDKPGTKITGYIQKIRKITSHSQREQIKQNAYKELAGLDFSIFCNNCLGGVFLHDIGRQFCSPTVNLAFDGEEFIKFLESPQYYLDGDFTFIEYEDITYPVAMLNDIEIRFVHYKTPEECVQKWRDRSKRIFWDNLFIIATDNDGLGRSDLLERFDHLPFKNKIMFTAQELPQYSWAITVPEYKGRFQVKGMTMFANLRGQRNYEKCFDLIEYIKQRCIENHNRLT